jgi:uncharacterized protein
VCTDVIIRAYRKVGIDLQREVHEDMRANFSAYPQNWGLKKPDKNIDHRRVPNLMVYFKRQHVMLTISDKASEYKPGNIVCWNLGGNTLHIGIVTNQKSADGKRNLIIHNIGAGQVLEDMLFNYPIIGHYRFSEVSQVFTRFSCAENRTFINRKNAVNNQTNEGGRSANYELTAFRAE